MRALERTSDALHTSEQTSENIMKMQEELYRKNQQPEQAAHIINISSCVGTNIV